MRVTDDGLVTNSPWVRDFLCQEEINLVNKMPEHLGEHEPRLIAKDVCASFGNLSAVLHEAVEGVLDGLPPWTAKETPRKVETVRLAYLVQIANKTRLPMARRVFDRLYTETDVFLYLVDARLLEPSLVKEALGVAGQEARGNVRVRAAPHTDFYLWPRVQVVLDGIESLLDTSWDFVVHLSESDYPLHSPAWLRANFARQRDSNFMRVVPRCMVPDGTPHLKGDRAGDLLYSSWTWWCSESLVASCGGEFPPGTANWTEFPIQALETHGVQFARGHEWVAITRELAEYALAPRLRHFKQLVGVHTGADELFWQTLVLNIPNFTQKISRQYWYITWSNPKQHSPDTINTTHLDNLLSTRSQFLFTRKVESPSSDAALDAIDRASKVDPPADLDILPPSGWEVSRRCIYEPAASAV